MPTNSDIRVSPLSTCRSKRNQECQYCVVGPRERVRRNGWLAILLCARRKPGLAYHHKQHPGKHAGADVNKHTLRIRDDMDQATRCRIAMITTPTTGTPWRKLAIAAIVTVFASAPTYVRSCAYRCTARGATNRRLMPAAA